MGRDEDVVALLLGGFEQLLDVPHCAVSFDAGSHQSPSYSVGTEEVVLRVGDDDLCSLCVESHDFLLVISVDLKTLPPNRSEIIVG